MVFSTNTRGLIAWIKDFNLAGGGGLIPNAFGDLKLSVNGSASQASGGLIGPAARFPGSGVLTSLNNLPGLPNAVTVCCWFSPGVTSRCDLVTSWNTGAGGAGLDQFNLLFGLTASKPQFFISDGSSTGNSGTGSAVLPIGSWNHVAGNYDGTTVSLYVNGVFQASAAPALTLGTGRPLRIGNNGAGDGQTTGSIADVRVYRRCLSVGEISAIYAEAFQKKKFWPGIDALGWIIPKAAPTIKFRRTLSPVGTRIGARQIQGWSQ
jgi:hypothetical protein